MTPKRESSNSVKRMPGGYERRKGSIPLIYARPIDLPGQQFLILRDA